VDPFRSDCRSAASPLTADLGGPPWASRSAMTPAAFAVDLVNLADLADLAVDLTDSAADLTDLAVDLAVLADRA